ncbi:MAG TPA: formate dehydrogenase accessory sulfurtransferase FdhD [Roseiflexaceae bacterium]|nr:formate dehydrogenase accessory sulfurtransferase FdhD [Roseiflexaceae bacterium]
MPEPVLNCDYIEYDGQRATAVTRPVIGETPWVLYVDRREWVTFMCSPVGLHHLALGFLLSEGAIGGLDDVWQLKVYLDENRVYMYFPDAGLAGELAMRTCEEASGAIDVRLRRPAPPRPERRVLTSGCGGGVTFDDLSGHRPPLQSDLAVTPAQVSTLMRALNESAALYRTSRGVHTSALADPDRLLVLAEDVGRHNTLDKIRGACLLEGISTDGRILVSSGRISSEMITKARKMNIPIVISRTSPTVMSIELAQAWHITLIGYVRGRQMRVYTGSQRVIFPEAPSPATSPSFPHDEDDG